jgi:iron complex transport system substrate-binding protein
MLRVALVFFWIGGCGKGTKGPATAPSVVTVASLVPAATDLIIGMGERDRLAAVSTFDRQRPDVGGLPMVGDYETVDWEKLAEVRPGVIIIQIRPDRLPAGFAERAAGLGARPMNVAINRLDDVLGAFDTLGEAMGTVQQAAAAKGVLQGRLDAVRRRVAGEKPVSTLLVLDEDGGAVAGPGTYLDDLLTLAGGVNAAAELKNPWPQIDREMLLSLKPGVIIELLPGASEQVKRRAAETWKNLPGIPAVASGRVYTVDAWYALLPGWHVADLAEQFSQWLHPNHPTTLP